MTTREHRGREAGASPRTCRTQTIDRRARASATERPGRPLTPALGIVFATVLGCVLWTVFLVVLRALT